MSDPPASTRAIWDRIRQYTGSREEGSPENRRRINEVANTVVGQMLPTGAVKGGAAMYFRYGAASRFSLDFDAAQALLVDEFVQRFEERLNEGWGGFTGTLVERKKAEPEGVHSAYVMQPFSIRLLYKGSKWPETIDFELSVDELGSAEEPEYVISDDALHLFDYLGLPPPEPVPVIPIVHQAAQKLHACTLPNSERAHDLIDLQLLLRRGGVDLAELAATTVRLRSPRHPRLASACPTDGRLGAAIRRSIG